MNNILIVEDDLTISKGLELVIKEIDEDINVFTTGSGSKAYEISVKENIDLFLLDIQLEDSTGYELAQKLRLIDRYKLTHIVFITALPSKEQKAYKKIHCYEYIIKPFSKDKVKQTLTTLIKYSNEETKSKKITIKQSGYNIVLEEKEIYYIESRSRNLYVHTSQEVIELTNYWLKTIIKDLSSDFAKCHKSYIVNKKHIRQIDKGNSALKLKGINDYIPIGRKYKDNVWEVK